MSTQAISVSQAPSSRGAGYRLMFLGFFGTWWCLIGCVGIYGSSVPVLAITTLAGLSIVVMGFLLKGEAVEPSPGEWDQRRQQRFRHINLMQWVAIVALIVILNVIGHTQWLLSGIMLIVGLHFLPLAKLFSSPLNAWTGAALIAVALAYPHLTQGGPESPVGPLAAGLLLWVSALITPVDLMRRRRAIGTQA
jgi:hypothetical protein